MMYVIKDVRHSLNPTTPQRFAPRRLHAAVVEPVSQRLWLIGGKHKTGITKISLNVVPLKGLFAYDVRKAASLLLTTTYFPTHYHHQGLCYGHHM